MQEEIKPAVSRRGLLRRAGTVAAGAGAVGVAAAVAGSPAQAADGQNLVIGQANTGTATTSLTAGSKTAPTLKLANPHAAGAALELAPVHLLPGDISPVVPSDLPLGAAYVDTFGDVHVIGAGNDGAGPKFDNMVYSATWATMTIPRAPERIVHTWSSYPGGGRALIVPGSANFDSLGRVLPKNNAGPDLVVDLTGFVSSGPAAVQLNLTVEAATFPGWAALFPGGTWPGNSSINFTAGGHATANFTQTVIANDGTISLKLYGSSAAIVIMDLCGFIVTDQFAQLIPGSDSAGASAFSSPNGRRSATPRRG